MSKVQMARFVENLNQAGLSIKYLSPECLASSFYRVGNLYKSKKVRYHKKQKCCPPIWRGIITAAILLPTCSALLVLLSDRLHSRIAHNGEIIQGAPSPNSPHTKYNGKLLGLELWRRPKHPSANRDRCYDRYDQLWTMKYDRVESKQLSGCILPPSVRN